MNEIPQPRSSDETDTSLGEDTTDSASSPTEEFTPSVLDEPGVDVSEYLETKQRAARRTRRFLQFAIGVAVIAIPVTYLKLNGKLSANGVRRALNQKVEEPKNNPSSSTFGLATPPSKDKPASTGLVKTKKSKAIGNDLTNYVFKDLKSINPDELKALSAFERVTGSNFSTEDNTFATVRDTVIPAYGRFLQRAESIQPRTPEVRAVHQVFVQSARVKALAFKHLLDGRGDKSAAWQYGVKAEFDASKELADQFKVQINSLAADQDVTLP